MHPCGRLGIVPKVFGAGADFVDSPEIIRNSRRFFLAASPNVGSFRSSKSVALAVLLPANHAWVMVTKAVNATILWLDSIERQNNGTITRPRVEARIV